MGGTSNFKVWTATQDSESGFIVMPDKAVMVGNKKNFIAAHQDGVTIVANSIVFGTISENIRTGGLFLQMNDFIRMIPSSIVTPIPPQVPAPPLAMFTGIIKHIPIVLAASA